ncbi:MAG TPA: sigma-70 family RNA polymerase sigma factor [Polyangiaceae bacterium]|nr:sigma-70 family RNA polymerase sigma factor [Polyangiaceae bacterium]
MKGSGHGVMADDNTERLLLSWRSGSRDAGDRLLRRYVPVLAGFFGRRASQHADDLVQRTLLACVQGIARFEGRSTFKSFLLGIARNQFLMWQRAEAFTGYEALTLPTLREDGPSHLAAVRQEHLILLGAVRRLEPEFSAVLKMFYFSDLSVEEVADELGIPTGTVKSRLARGRAALKIDLTRMELREGVRAAALEELSRWLSTRRD